MSLIDLLIAYTSNVDTIREIAKTLNTTPHEIQYTLDQFLNEWNEANEEEIDEILEKYEQELKNL